MQSLYQVSLVLSINFFNASLYADDLKVTLDQNGVTCLQDPKSQEWSNSFLITSGTDRLLIDSGWSEDATVPVALQDDIQRATKVATHFHCDHIRNWSLQEHIALAGKQAKYCASPTHCAPGLLRTVFRADPFIYAETYQTDAMLPGGVKVLACEGHSQSDVCFLHEASRTLFVGDLFYPGPVFIFPPGGSLRELNLTLQRLLTLTNWDRLGITHGDCFVSREVFQTFAVSVKQIAEGAATWQWHFSSFLPLPLRETETATGTLLRWPFQK